MAPKHLRGQTGLFLSLFLAFTIIGSPLRAAALSPTHVLPSPLPDLETFVQTVQNGQVGDLRGVYVPAVMALRVAQQPVGDAGFVSPDADVATQFSLASKSGNLGLLAHNTLAGKYFSLLVTGQTIVLVYGDGSTQVFIVILVERYQALSPHSTRSEFKDLKSGKQVSAETIFHRMYAGAYHLTLQTCIASSNDPDWGRLFIIARPIQIIR